MAIAEKLQNIINEKSAQATMTNYGLTSANQITSSTKFIDYPKYIFNAFLEALRTPDTLFTNLPKITGSGSNITLNDTANAPMRIELGATELTQAGTPTPSSPQDIHTISGSNTIRVEGKNLFDKNNPTIIDGFVNGSTGILSAPTNNQKSIAISILPNTTYTISGVERSYSNTGLFSDNTLTIGTSVATLNTGISGGTKTFTTGNNDKWLVFLLRGGTETYGYNNLQLEKGSQATTYEPYNGTNYSVNLGGQNLFDFENNMWFIANNAVGIKQENSIYVKCASSQYGHIRYPNLSLNLKPNTTYTFSARVVSTNTTNGSSVFVSGNLINGGTAVYGNKVTAGGTSYVTFTTPSTITGDMNSAYVGLYPRESDKEATFDQIQIRESSQLLDYVPYYTPIEYCKIGNYEDKFIRNSGKNLFDYSINIINNAFPNNSTMQITTDNNCKMSYLKCEPNTTYTISRRTPMATRFAVTTTETTPAIGTTMLSFDYNNTGESITITTGANAHYIVIRFIYNEINDYETYAKTIQVEKGSTATDYEPYGSNEWYIKKNIGKTVLNGTENWEDRPNFNDCDRFVFNAQNIIDQKSNVYNGISNYFQIDDGSSLSSNYPRLRFNNGQIVINYSTKGTTTLADFKTWLGTHNTIGYYILATPTYTQITGTLAEQLEYVYKKMMSQKGQTNISQVNNDLSFNLSVQAIEDLS